MADVEWEPEPGGLMAADCYPFRLLVRRSAARGGSAQFLVLRHPRDAGKFPCAILASGDRDTYPEAMSAAEAVARRIRTRPAIA